jgi:GNAT superfamily N-acetyltransferase
MQADALPSDAIAVRLSSSEDIEALVDFNLRMAMETEGRTLNRETLTGGVSALFARDGLGFYLVAEHPVEGVAAALMVTYEWSDWRNGCFWWIQSVYVRPEFRRRGLYRALYDFVRNLAGERGGVCGFRLYVEKDNEVARQTYASLGMGETYYRMYESH